MTGAFSRNKGARAERELCGLLREYLGVEATRNLKQYQAAQHGDIEQLVGPYLIECKDHKTLAVKSWWEQASGAARARSGNVLMTATGVSVDARPGGVVLCNDPRDFAMVPRIVQPCVAYRLGNRGLYDRWRFVVPDERRPTQDWELDYRYTADLGLEAFAVRVREQLGG